MYLKGKFALALPATVLLSLLITASYAADPGLGIPANSELSDQKTGSVLFYNLYTSAPSSPNSQNSRISVTNTSSTLAVRVHFFFVEGATSSLSDKFICLTQAQTINFLASTEDPGVTGYAVAVAVDAAACPINFNFLTGSADIKLNSGHAACLSAEAFTAISPSPVTCSGNSATLSFDGVSYNSLPRVLLLNKLRSLTDGNDLLLIVNGIGGDLRTNGAVRISALSGTLFDDAENSVDFSCPSTSPPCQFRPTCQFIRSLSNTFPATAPRFTSVIPTGRTGWMRFYATDSAGNEVGILGAAINFNQNAATAAGAFSGGHNLHMLTLTASRVTLTIPVIPPTC